MTERLHYELGERGFRVIGPKDIVDGAMSRVGGGPLRRDMNAATTLRAFEHTRSGGLVELNFASDPLPSQAPWLSVARHEARARSALAALVQLDDFAYSAGAGDHRLRITSESDEDYDYQSRDPLIVGFERPDGNFPEIEAKAHRALQRSAALLGLSPDRNEMTAHYGETKIGFEVGRAGLTYSHNPNVIINRPTRMVELRSGYNKDNPREQLASLMAVMAIMPAVSIYDRDKEFQQLSGERRVGAEPELRQLVEEAVGLVNAYSKSEDEFSDEVVWRTSDGTAEVVITYAAGGNTYAGFRGSDLWIAVRYAGDKSQAGVKPTKALEFSHYNSGVFGGLEHNSDMTVQAYSLNMPGLLSTIDYIVRPKLVSDFKRVLANVAESLKKDAVAEEYYSNRTRRRETMYVEASSEMDESLVARRIHRILARG